MGLILAFLGRNWIYVAIGIVFALMLGYIGILKLEVGHYKGELAQAELVINTYKAKEAALEKENDRITKAHAETLKRYKEEILKNVKTTMEKIAANEELKRTRISLDAARLFNESKRSPDSKDPPDTIEGNDGDPGGTPTISLAEIFKQVAVNDANHLQCVHQVLEWQSFWKEYSTAVSIINPSD